jgi:hypothetical protein
MNKSIGFFTSTIIGERYAHPTGFIPYTDIGFPLYELQTFREAQGANVVKCSHPKWSTHVYPKS